MSPGGVRRERPPASPLNHISSVEINICTACIIETRYSMQSKTVLLHCHCGVSDTFSASVVRWPTTACTHARTPLLRAIRYSHVTHSRASSQFLSLSLSHRAAALITSSGALNQLHNSHFTVYHIGATVSLLIVCYYRTNANNVVLLYTLTVTCLSQMHAFLVVQFADLSTNGVYW